MFDENDAAKDVAAGPWSLAGPCVLIFLAWAGFSLWALWAFAEYFNG